MSKEVLFSVTANDCDWEYMRGTGPGGQKRNKTESKVRCVHRDSGAVGESDETRSQHDNKRKAFVKMASTSIKNIKFALTRCRNGVTRTWNIGGSHQPVTVTTSSGSPTKETICYSY